MVALSRKQAIRQAQYFGSKNIYGSNEKAVTLQGFGMVPMGGNLYTFDIYNPDTEGEGLTITGTGILSKLKKLADPLLKKGKEIAVKELQKGVEKGKKKLIETAKEKAKDISNPSLKKLAETGIMAGDKALEQALKGTKDLSKYTDIFKEGAKEAVPDFVDYGSSKAQKGLTKILGGEDEADDWGFDELGSGFSSGEMKMLKKMKLKNKMKQLQSGKGMKGISQKDLKKIQKMMLKKKLKNMQRGTGMKGTPALRTEAPPSYNTLNYTEARPQLRILKDVIRSKPITEPITRGSGLYTY